MTMTYKIVRYYADERPAVVLLTGLTEAQVKSYCSNPATKGKDWFDGFTEDGPEILVESYDPDDPNCTCPGSRNVDCPSHGDES